MELILPDQTKRTIRTCNSCQREIYFSEVAMGHCLPYNVSNFRQHVCHEGLRKYGKFIWNPRSVHTCNFCHEKITGPHWLRKMAQGFGSERYHNQCVTDQLNAPKMD